MGMNRTEAIGLIVQAAAMQLLLNRQRERLDVNLTGEGFKPPLPARVKGGARPPVSTTHTSLRIVPVCQARRLSTNAATGA